MTRTIIFIILASIAHLGLAQTVIFIGPVGISKGNSMNVIGIGPSNTLPPFQEQYFTSAKPFSERVGIFNSPSDHIIPEYIRENPMQFSYLCRLEKKIERKLPVGLWLKLEDNNFAQSFSPRPGNAYIRMKMVRF